MDERGKPQTTTTTTAAASSQQYIQITNENVTQSNQKSRQARAHTGYVCQINTTF